jgi:hypothetical protein
LGQIQPSPIGPQKTLTLGLLLYIGVLTWKFSIPTPLFSLATTAISPSLLFQPRAQYSLSFLKRAGAPSSHGSFLLAPSPRIFARRALLWPWDRLATSPSILLCVRKGSHGAFFFHGRGHPPFSPWPSSTCQDPTRALLLQPWRRALLWFELELVSHRCPWPTPCSGDGSRAPCATSPATSSTSTQPPLPCSCHGRAPSVADRTPSPASSHGALHSVPSPLFFPLVAQKLLGPTSARSMSMAPSSSSLPVHGRQPLLLFTEPSSSSLPWWTLGARAPFPLLRAAAQCPLALARCSTQCAAAPTAPRAAGLLFCVAQ